MDEEAKPSTAERGGAQPTRTDVEDPQTNTNGDQVVSQEEVISRAVSSAISEEEVTVSAQAKNGEVKIEHVCPEIPTSDGQRGSVDQNSAGGANAAQADPATPTEEAVAIQGGQNSDGEEVISQDGPTIPSEEPMSVNREQPHTGLVNVAPNAQTPLSEELVTVPIMKLQQLVEFCAQVLRESRSREAPAPDLESGPLPTSLPDITTDPLEVVGNYIFTDKDFIVGKCFGRSNYSIPPQHKQEVEEIWNSADNFPIRDLFTSKEDPSAKSLIESCLTVANLDVLFRDENALFGTNIKSLKEIFQLHMDYADPQNLRYHYPDFDWKMMVTVCVYGSKVHSLGGILQNCYSTGVLARPASSEPSKYLSDIWKVMRYMLLFNRAFTISVYEGMTGISTYADWSPTRSYHQSLYGMLPPLFTGRNLHTILGISPAQLLRMLFIANTDANLKALDVAAGTTLRLDDLNIRSLESLGSLRIVWTLVLENHLLLNLVDMTLSVVWQVLDYWQSSPMGAWEVIAMDAVGKGFCGSTYSHDGLLNRLDSEIIKTWAFLFATDPRLEIRKKDYESIDGNILMSPTLYFDPKPYKLLECYEDIRSQHLGEAFDYDCLRSYDSYPEMFEAARSKKLVPYAQFPVYENRLRQLRHYMDSQKPRGFRQLWKDKRDTLNYYTFWGVIIFGSLSIFLAFFSLAVSVAQTVASFKALNAS